MYNQRTLENTIEKLSTEFPAIVIYGPRQCGKSTRVNHLFQKRRRSVTLDDPEDLSLALNNPKLFLDTYQWPVIIDEIQRAPILLNVIKMRIDQRKSEWLKEDKSYQLRYVLTGSNQFELQQGISESLAGRVAVVELNSFSLAEKTGRKSSIFDPEVSALLKKEEQETKVYSRPEIFNEIFEGGYPEVALKKIGRDNYFRSYLSTYLEKDIRQLISAGNETAFLNFLSYVALRTGQEIRYEEISSSVGIDVKTVKRWLLILQTSGIIALLQPFRKNTSNRIIKAPKRYFMDTGLAAYLCKWPNAERLEKGVRAGAFFETFVVSELIKNFQFHGLDYRTSLFYYRDTNQKEIDVLFVKNQEIYPIEIKKGVNPTKPDKNFNVLAKCRLPIKTGLILDCTDRIRPINEKAYCIPLGLIE